VSPKAIVGAALLASGALGCAHAPALGVAAPLQCRANGLWTLERHPARDVQGTWLILAMAPWDSWTTGFRLSDGQSGSLTLRVSDVSRDQLALIARQAEQDREPTIFTRGSTVGCAFYAADDVETYRFRRQR